MVLDSLRGKTDGLISSLSRPFMGMNPNTISLLSLVLAGLSGLTIWMGGVYLIAAFIFLVLSALFDAVDGKVARTKHLSSPLGDLVDHVLDRYSDILIMLGFIFSVPGSRFLGIFALIGVLMTSYMGTQSQALGLKRNYSGILGRADRLAFMMIFILIQLLAPFFIHMLLFNITPTAILPLMLAGPAQQFLEPGP